jgi:hypothetical protein
MKAANDKSPPRPPRLHRTIGVLASALGVAALTGAATTEPRPAKGEMGFVFNAFAPAVYQGKDDCPEGLAGTVKENYLQSLPGAERDRLLLKANEPELTKRWKASVVGPNNTNICSNPELFDRPMQKTLQGKVAPGLNLDGDGAESCAHDDFTGVDGATGVDNQVYRAMGCTRNYRGVDGTAGDVVKGFNDLLATGEHSVVLLLRGVDSVTDDDDVEVIIGSTDDRPVLDSQRHFITGASFSFSDRNPAWRNVLHGRIVRGELTTDPAEIRLKRPWGQGGVRGARSEWDLHRARLKLQFQPDGSVKGLLGAYQTPRNVILSTILGGLGAGETAGIDCAAQYATMTKLADGLRDPKTGRCTAVSMALQVAAVPAFVIDRAPSASVASAGGQ